jgi:chromosome segregation ATPase
MLKSKISKSVYDGLNDILKAEYKVDGDNYVLDTDDATELRNSLTTVKKERDDAKKALTDAQKEMETLKAAGGDFTRIEQQYKDKIAKLEGEVSTANANVTKIREDMTLGTAAAELAKKHFTTPSLLNEGNTRADGP